MRPIVITTDGGPHPAEKWAVVTAGQIMQIDPKADRNGTARKFELKIIEILENHHGKVQDHERAKIKEHGVDRLTHDYSETIEHSKDPFNEIIKAAEGTPYEKHFAKQEIQDHLRRTIATNFATSMSIERHYLADANADHPHSKKFKINGGNPVK